jgi:hypothetical protein
LYNDPSLSEPVTVHAKVYGERAERRQNDYGWYWVQLRSIELMECEQAIRSDGTFTVDDKDYSIEAIGDKDARRTRVELTRSQAGEISRPGYRGNA